MFWSNAANSSALTKPWKRWPEKRARAKENSSIVATMLPICTTFRNTRLSTR